MADLMPSEIPLSVKKRRPLRQCKKPDYRSQLEAEKLVNNHRKKTTASHRQSWSAGVPEVRVMFKDLNKYFQEVDKWQMEEEDAGLGFGSNTSIADGSDADSSWEDQPSVDERDVFATGRAAAGKENPKAGKAANKPSAAAPTALLQRPALIERSNQPVAPTPTLATHSSILATPQLAAFIPAAPFSAQVPPASAKAPASVHVPVPVPAKAAMGPPPARPQPKQRAAKPAAAIAPKPAAPTVPDSPLEAFASFAPAPLPLKAAAAAPFTPAQPQRRAPAASAMNNSTVMDQSTHNVSAAPSHVPPTPEGAVMATPSLGMLLLRGFRVPMVETPAGGTGADNSTCIENVPLQDVLAGLFPGQ
jgi:hypothetical protein